ncbi:MAG: SpoIIIAH-like family protein [Lachnospiraceae bacterium]|nr:SpoIIIAH-like family protein [Lachnospiraceae bacterium]
MKFGKRELIMSALVLSLGAAVYVNWQFGENSADLDAGKSDEELGAAQYVNASISNPSDSTGSDKTSSDKTVTSKNEDSNSSKNTSSDKENSTDIDTESKLLSKTEQYFAQVRLEREQTQDELIELAQGVVSATDTSGKGKEDAVKQLNKMTDTIQQQSNIESLIIAKGFDDCIAFIQNGECSIVVTGQELKADSLIAIKDIVTGQTDITFDKIKVTHI